MKKLIYTPDTIEKLQETELYLKMMFGNEIAAETKRKICERIRSLKTAEMQGISVRGVYGIEIDYRKIYTSHHHVFYRIEEDAIRVIAIFHEREDFIRKLFGSETEP